MKPTLLSGDLVFYKKFNIDKSVLQTGDIVIFKEPIDNSVCIKRVHEISNYGISVSGDNSKYSKDSKSYGTVPMVNVLGIVTSVISDKNF